MSQPNSQGSSESGAAPAARRWLFRLAVLILVPVLLIGLPEAALRLAEFGHPTGFFLKREIGGQPVYIENGDFGLRFFPAELARTPSPVVMPAAKPPGTYRIFVLGESAALGDPEPAFGFGRYLQALLQERYPGTEFEVVCTAMTAINSHVILPIAKDCAARDGDLWVVYMGNNEFVGPFGPGTVFGAQTPKLGFIRGTIALKQLRLVQWLESMAHQHEEAGVKKSPAWGGMKMFLDHQVGPEDPRKALVYQYFQKNLEDILDVASAAGAKVVLSTVGSNIKDCVPFASTNSASLSGAAMSDWRQAYTVGVTSLSMGDYAGALGQFKNAIKLDGTFAALHYGSGKCLLGMENFEEAAREFQLARDQDSLPFRADTQINKVIAEVGARRAGPGLAFADGAAAISAVSGQGIAGREYFYEHVHLNFEGNYLLARTVADSVAKLLPAAIAGKAAPGGSWASFDDCSRRLALNDWDRRRVYDNIAHRFLEPPFVNQPDHTNQMNNIRRDIAALRPHIKPETVQQVKLNYQDVMKARPQDFHIVGNYAKFLEDTGDIEGAMKAWQQERDLLPFEAAPYFFLGKLQARQKKVDEALANLSKALEIRSDIPDALDEKGRLLTDKRRLDEAIPLLDRALHLQPSNPRVMLHLADAYAAKGDRAQAFDYLKQAVAAQPSQWEPHYFLGVELAARDKIQDAAREFAEVVRLRPDYSLGHFNLGIALAKMGRLNDAIAQLNETVRLDPGNNKAVQYLNALQKR